MSTASSCAEAQQPVTSRTPFYRINAAGDLLFEVRSGIPVLDAMEMASCYMASARDVASMAMENPSGIAGAYYLIELAKATLDSVIETWVKEGYDHAQDHH